MTTLEIDGQTQTVWRCEAGSYFDPLVFGTGRPAKLTRHPYVRLTLADRVLTCWVEHPVVAAEVTAVDTRAATMRLASGAEVPARIQSRQPKAEEVRWLAQERQLAASQALTTALARAGATTGSQPSAATLAEPPKPPEVNETILWHFQQKIQDELDVRLKSAPSASQVFTLYCRDRLTLAKMARKHGWSVRTLKSRKAALKEFLWRKHRLTLEAFFLDRRIFDTAERVRRDYRARSISPRELAERDDADQAPE